MQITKQTREVVVLNNGEVAEIKISQERAKQLIDGIYNNNAQGIDLFFNNCELITELRNSNGYYTLGYNSFKELAEELFDSGETQAKNMCLIAQDFGKVNEDGSYTIQDKELLKNFSATQLLYIRGLKGFDGNILTTCDIYGIDVTQSKKVTCATLRELVKQEKKAKEVIALSDMQEPAKKSKEVAKQDKEPVKVGEPVNVEITEDKKPLEKVEDYDRMKNDFERVERVAKSASQAIEEIEKILENKDKATQKLFAIKEIIENLKK